MEKIIVYINHADHALALLAPMKRQTSGSSSGAEGTRWVLVACAPRMTRHVSKWVTGSVRQSWREKWCAKVLAQLAPILKTEGDQVELVVAREPLVQMTADLLAKYGPARVLDARLALAGQQLQPVTRDQPTEPVNRWALPSALVGMGTVMALASE
jgi:hypothetical protein